MLRHPTGWEVTLVEPLLIPQIAGADRSGYPEPPRQTCNWKPLFLLVCSQEWLTGGVATELASSGEGIKFRPLSQFDLWVEEGEEISLKASQNWQADFRKEASPRRLVLELSWEWNTCINDGAEKWAGWPGVMLVQDQRVMWVGFSFLFSPKMRREKCCVMWTPSQTFQAENHWLMADFFPPLILSSQIHHEIHKGSCF